MGCAEVISFEEVRTCKETVEHATPTAPYAI